MPPTRAATALLLAAVLPGCTKTIVPPFGGQAIASTLVRVAGNEQTGAPGQPLSISPAVRVTSGEGQPVKDVTIVFTPSSGGSVTDAVVRSDANGVAVAGKWVLGPTPGQQTLSATLPGVTSVTFVATARAPVGTSPNKILISSRPYGVAVAPSGLIYASQLDGRSVTSVQAGSTTLSSVVLVGNTPTDVTFTPDGSAAFVTNQFDRSVGVIDVASARQTQLIQGSASIFRAIVAPNGQRAYATETDGRLLVIDVATRSLLGLIPIGVDANGLAFGSADTLLYVTSMRGTVSVVNLKTNSVVHTWTLGGTLQDIAVSPDGTTLYVAHEESGIIDVVSAGTGTVTARFLTDAGIFGLKVAPDTRFLYATEPLAGRVLVLDRATGGVTRTFTVGGIPRRIAFDRTSGRVVVSNEFGWLDIL